MHAQSKKRVTFSYSAPDAREVLLAGEFTSWEEQPVRLKKGAEGQWKATVLLEPGQYQYRFLVDGQWRDDPECSKREANNFGSENCVCVVAPAVKRKPKSSSG